MSKWISFVLFILTIPAANWMIGNVGTMCIPNGPCMIPVGLGLLAPSGVLLVGIAMVLRDWIHEQHGTRGALVAIAIGGGLSALFAPPALVVASVAAFMLAEVADLAVYIPLRKRGLGLAVLGSGLIGSIVDSAIFLLLAFGSLQFIEGQILGKLWMSALAFGFLHVASIRRVTAAHG
jgi:uncharacterized PurR-regulated membrane protein YhhQ (DUF165 family)